MRVFIFLLMLLYPYYKGQYSSMWYNVDIGLPQNSVKDIVKDKYGFIWLSTEKGLVRYDGNSFISYGNLNITNMHFGSFHGSAEKDEIVTWNDNQENAVLINKRKAKVYNKYKSSGSLMHADGKVYQNFSKSFLNERIFNNMNYFTKFKSGTYFFHDDFIEYKNNETGKITFIHLNFHLKNLKNTFAHGETLFITDPINRKTYRIEKGTVQVLDGESVYNDPGTNIYWKQMNNQVFIINDNNIYLSRYENGKLKTQKILHYKDIGSYSFRSMYYDEEYGKIYLGSVTKGLNIINISNFFVAKQNILFADEVYYASLPFGENKIITDGGKVFDRYGLVNDLQFESDPSKMLMFFDDSQNIVYSKEYRLKKRYRVNGYEKSDSLKFHYYPTGIAKTNGKYALILRNTLKGYSNICISKDDQFNSISKQYKFNSSIYSAVFYNDHTLLAGGNKGLYKISLNDNKIQTLNNTLNIRSILRTTEGNFWLTTQNQGFYLLRKDRLLKMPYDKDGFLASTHCFLEDKAGYLWISSNNGLFKVLKSKLLEYSNNPNIKVAYYKYDKYDGLKESEFNGGCTPSANILKNGEFVFPTMEGFVFFNPEQIKSYYPDPKSIFIERADVSRSETFFQNNTLNLENDQENAGVYIDIPYYGNNDNLHVEARITGSDRSEWQRVKNNRYLISNLAPGKYKLDVRMLISPEGEFVYKTLNVVVHPKFYQTFLFKALIFLIFITVILWIIKIRTNLKSKNKSLEKIVFEKDGELKQATEDLEKTQEILKNETEYQKKILETISHDITTPIKYLSNLSKNLYQTDNVELQRKYFDSIYKSSEELYKFTLGLKEYSNLYRDEKKFEEEEYSIFELLENKVKLFREIAFVNNTHIDNAADHEIKTNVNKNILLTIIHNLLDNAVKNTEKGKIVIETEIQHESVIITISDTGRGISQQQIDYYTQLFENSNHEEFSLKKYGLGLHMVLYFVAGIRGHISFSKNKPKGTIVKITLKKTGYEKENTHY